MSAPTCRAKRASFPILVVALWAALGAPGAAAVERFARFEHAGDVAYGRVVGDEVHEIAGDLFGAREESGRRFALSDVRLLAPVAPSKMLAAGFNYRSHTGGRIPPRPELFAKLPSAVVAPGDAIVVPSGSPTTHYEGELVVIIGKRAKNVPVAQAAEYVFGVTAGNDVTERTWQRTDMQWLRAKSSDTFAPLGPLAVRGLDYRDLLLTTRVNGEVRQHDSTSNLIYGVDELVSYASHFVTLLPGDVIFTGTPGSTRALHPGDVVEIEVQGVGALRNRVVGD